MSISVKQLKKILGSFSQAVAKDVSGIKTAKQNKLVAGENIKITEDGTISATVATANVDLTAYSTTSQVETLVDGKIAPLATKQEVEEKVNTIQIPSVEGLAKTTEVDTKLADYAKTAEVAETYATKEAVNAINGLDVDTIATLKNLSQNSDLTTIANKVDNVYTKAETDDKLATKADVTAIPDVSGLATKQEVTAAVAGVQVPSIEGLAKTTEVDTKLADYAKKTELPDVSTLATKAEVAAITVPSVEGFIKDAEVDAKLVNYAKTTEVESTYAKKSELPDVSSLATKQEVTEAIAGVQVPSIEGLAKITDVDAKLATKADATAIPNISNLATKEEVNAVDNKLATKADISAIPSIEGLATKAEVTEAVTGLAKASEVAETYATKEAVNAVAGLDADTVSTLKTLAQNSDLTTIAEKVKNVYTKAETDNKLATKADVTAIPDISGLATKAEVATIDAKFATKADVSAIPSIEGLAKTTDIEAAYAKKTELPDVSGLATKAEVEALKTDFVTEETLTQNINQFSTNIDGKINEAKGELEAKVTAVDTKLSDYAKKTELPDVSGLATKAEVTTAVAGVQVPSIEGLAKTTDIEATYAKKTEIPDVSGLAVKTEVETTYAKKTELPDISGLATKAELPSIEGLAKTTEVVAKSVYDEKVQSLESEISALKAKLAAVASGTTEQRPTENLVVGQQYFDTTLGVPVYWNGTEWHNPFANITTVEVENH